ncbi:MAG: tRNA pseudouridine(38-40) synthase TruA [Chlamydiia bacterium]|nr:tRNA pseudouridine(38-40) synthase TruA [Chlamydiia bacterium]
MANYKLIVAYEGTNLLGWQKTRMGRSVEEELEKALQTIFQQPISLQAASRTDAGVHALGQVVNVHLEKEATGALVSLNQLLPADIAVLSIERVADEFHPTLHALGKEYHYTLRTSTFHIPQERHLVWHFPYALDIERIRAASQDFLGTHDFKAFCNVKKNDPETDFIRTVTHIEITEPQRDKILFKVEGNRFLYKMVRNIIGTLVYIGCGKLPSDIIPQLLEGKDRTAAGVTAPAHGLTLFRVKY